MLFEHLLYFLPGEFSKSIVRDIHGRLEPCNVEHRFTSHIHEKTLGLNKALPGDRLYIGRRLCTRTFVLTVVVLLDFHWVGSASNTVLPLVPKLDLSEAAADSVVQHHRSLKISTAQHNQLHRFDCHDHSDDSGQHPNDPSGRAATRRYFIVSPKTSVAGRPQTIRSDLSFPPNAGPAQQRLFNSLTVVVNEVAALGIVGAVQHQIVFVDVG